MNVTGKDDAPVLSVDKVLTVREGDSDRAGDSGQATAYDADSVDQSDGALRYGLKVPTDADGKPQPLVAILWGRNAQSLEPLLTNAFIIKSPHPSPLSASRGFFGSKPFSRANQALVTMGADPVDWTL